jgi:hypothetical protein
MILSSTRFRYLRHAGRANGSTLTRRTKHLVGAGPDCLLAATGWGEA